MTNKILSAKNLLNESCLDGVLFSNREKWKNDICRKMVGARDHYIKVKQARLRQIGLTQTWILNLRKRIYMHGDTHL